jgi:hypothetical protein
MIMQKQSIEPILKRRGSGKSTTNKGIRLEKTTMVEKLEWVKKNVSLKKIKYRMNSNSDKNKF